MIKNLFNQLIKFFLKQKIQFIDIKEKDKIVACLKMKDEAIETYFKSRLTDNIIYHTFCKKEEKDEIKGRINEDLDILNLIERASDDALEIESRAKKEKYRREYDKLSPYWSIKNKLLNIKTRRNQNETT